MNSKLSHSINLALGLALTATLSSGAMAQSDNLEQEYPELAKLFNAFSVTQAEAFDAIAEINADRSTQQARRDLRMELDMANNMDSNDMHSMHGGDMDMSAMNSTGPYGELEVQARAQLGRLVRGDYSDETAENAYLDADAIPQHAARALMWGRKFEDDLWNIWADPDMSVNGKQAATAEAITAYETEDARHAVSVQPKNAELYLEHDYANGLKTAFPRISGLLWANQWLQLASLEAIILGPVDPQFAGEVPTTLERYYNKLGSDTGMTMFPAPNEMPSSPAISPQLYSLAPQAAIILDNINMMEVAIADAIAYPNLENRDEIVEGIVEQFVGSDDYEVDEMTYLLSALRGGIFNQGGPAIGELMGSERNRSREAMDMQHTMIMSSPQ